MINNIFEQETVSRTFDRINNLSADKKPVWGKMDAAQMLAHCNAAYELHLDKIYPKPNFFIKFIMKLFVKNIVVSNKPYKRNNTTAPQMLITEEKNFDVEKQRLVTYIEKVKKLGESHFNGKESFSFGDLSSKEWNNLFYKHLDHHLNQFGV